MDAHKSEVLSINLSSADFLQTEPDSEEAWELRDGLKEMNARWDRLGSSLEDWREELQRALMRCQVLKLFVFPLQKKKQMKKNTNIQWNVKSENTHTQGYFTISPFRSSMR